MVRLLRANLARLWKTTAFWGCLIFPAGLGLLMQLMEGRGSGFFRSMYNITPVSLFFSVVFSVMYISTDNSDKTVRNKLIIGISRAKIYFANLITVSVGMVLIFAAGWSALIIYDIIHGGGLDIEMWLLILYAVLCLIAGVAMVAVCALPATLVTSRPLANAIALALTIGMFFVTGYLLNFSNSSSAAKTAFSILPTSQIEIIRTRVSFMDGSSEIYDVGNVMEPMWYSLGLTAAASAVGALTFRRKDLK